jgi:MSHA pilin protein MshA
MMKLKNARGFTLIEFIVIITIMAILSAIAFTKYINIQTQARVSKALAIFGTVRTAANLAKASCVLDTAGVNPSPTCTQTGGTVNMDGTAVDMVYLYPAATAAGIIAATQLDVTYDGITIVAGNPLLITINGATTPANCAISYTQAVSGAAPTMTLTTSGC